MEKQRQAEELHRQAEELSAKADEFDKAREVEFYAAALDAFYTTSLEYDKGIFTLAAGGLGLLVTLLTTAGLANRVELVAYLGGIVAFTVTLVLLLLTFKLNKSHIIAVVSNVNEKLTTDRLKRLEAASMVFFGIGIVCAAVVGVLAATDSYNTKVKAMTDSKKPGGLTLTKDDATIHTTHPRQDEELQKSFIGAGKLRPQASTGASQPAAPVTPAASTPQASGAPPTSNSTPKGK